MTSHEDDSPAAISQKPDRGKVAEKTEAERKAASRDDTDKGRTARDATGINPKKREPIDPAMPNMPPA